MYFTKGKQRRYERLLQTRPGVDRYAPLDGELEKPRKRNRCAHKFSMKLG